MGEARAVVGLGVCLPVARDGATLAARLAVGTDLAGIRRHYHADQTDLPPVHLPVGLCGEPLPPRAVRTAGLPRESKLALCAAADALAPLDAARGAQVGVVWISSTAGLEEYGRTCVEAATLPAGQASPLAAPGSAYNGPAATVSIRLALTGPQLTMIGDRDAGASALVEADRLLGEGRCRYVLVGGSASLSAWRLAGAAPHPVPAEGAICLVLGPPDGVYGHPGAGHGVLIRPLRRARLPRAASDAASTAANDAPSTAINGAADGALAAFAADCLGRMGGTPDALALSVAAPWRDDASVLPPGGGTRLWQVDHLGGDLGAASGLGAVVAAIAGCESGAVRASRVLALAVGATGNAAGVEIASRNTAAQKTTSQNTTSQKTASQKIPSQKITSRRGASR